MANHHFLFSYATNIADMYCGAAAYVDKILKGASRATCRCSTRSSSS